MGTTTNSHQPFSVVLVYIPTPAHLLGWGEGAGILCPPFVLKLALTSYLPATPTPLGGGCSGSLPVFMFFILEELTNVPGLGMPGSVDVGSCISSTTLCLLARYISYSLAEESLLIRLTSLCLSLMLPVSSIFLQMLPFFINLLVNFPPFSPVPQKTIP